jgi:hypothetical protein
VTQFLQKRAHAGLSSVFENPGPLEAPWQLQLIVGIPGIQRLMGHLIGIGLRPERPKTRASGGRFLIGIACGVGAALAFVKYRNASRSR